MIFHSIRCEYSCKYKKVFSDSNNKRNINKGIFCRNLNVLREVSLVNNLHGHQSVGEERCASFEALLRAINLWPNAPLKAVSPPAFQSVGRTRKQREHEASGFAARLSRSLFSRSSYTDLMGLRAKESLFAI